MCVCVCICMSERERARGHMYLLTLKFVRRPSSSICMCVFMPGFCLHCGLSEDSGATNDNKTIHGTYRRDTHAHFFSIFACVLVDVFRARSLVLIRLELVVCSFFVRLAFVIVR